MNDISTPRTYRCDLNHGTCIVNLKAPLMHQDSLADVFRVAVCRANVPVDLAGMGVTGYLYYASTRQTLLLQGTTDGHYASVALSSPCYATPGYASLVIQLQDGDVRHTLLKANFCIDRTGTESVLDPDDVLPSLPDLLGQIETLRAVTAQGKEVIADIQADTDAAIARTDAAAASADAAAQAAEAAGQEAVRIAREASQPAIAAGKEAAHSAEAAARSAQEAAQSSLDAAESAQTAAATLSAVQETVTQETAQAVEAIDAREAEAVEAVAARETAAASALDDQKAASVQAVHRAAQTAAAQQEEAIAAKGQATLASIPEDYTALHAAVQQNTADILLQAPAIIETATGSIVSITDGAERPAVSLVTHIEPVQEGSGDPSPDHVRPISGWDHVTAQQTGKNLLPVNSITFETSGRVQFPVSLKPGTYTLSAMVTSDDADDTESLAVFRKKDGVMLANPSFKRGVYTYQTITLRDDCEAVDFYAAVGAANSTGDAATWDEVMLVSGSANHPYEPYQGQTLTAELPETVYGGTLDWGTGVLTVDRTCELLLNDGGWVQGKANPNYYTNHNYGKKMYYKRGDKSTLICTHGVWMATNATPAVGTPSDCVYGYHKSWIGMTSDYSTLAEFAAWLDAQQQAGTPVTVVYKLETPYTIQLTPQQLSTLKGTNNVWSDCGDTTLAYIADTKLYIDRKIAAIAAATV